MNIDANTTSSAQLADWIANESIMAQRANEAESRTENARHVAALSDFANSAQQAEHIRGVVAATMSQISIHAAPATRENATRWQTWALGLADGVYKASAQATQASPSITLGE